MSPALEERPVPPRILIVEDDALVAADLQESVERLGYLVAAVVHSGAAAVRVAGVGGVDLALMDIRLPGQMDGTEAAGAIRERDQIPVVYVTAYADDSTLARAGRTNPFGYLVKPFDERRLKSAIELALSRARAEAGLVAVRERCRRQFEGAAVGHAVTTPEGRLLECNGAFLRIAGFGSLEEAQAADLVRLHRDPERRRGILSRVREEGSVQGEVLRLVSERGGAAHVLVNATGSFDSDGELIELHEFWIDVTEQRRVQRQLRESLKAEALERLSGAVSEQLNDVLSLIRDETGQLLPASSRDESVAEGLSRIREALRRAEGVARKLRDTGASDRADRRWIEVHELVRRLAGEIEHDLPEGISLETELRPCGSSFADPVQVEAILLEVVENAVEAMQGRGTLIIRSDPEPAVDDRGSLQPGARMCITVQDTGPGIEERDLERVFDPYFTSRPGKTGLGLARARAFAKRNEGSLRLESSPGTGTTLLIHLPVVEEAPGAPGRPASSTTEAPRRETVLIVDDDDLFRDAACWSLAGLGYHVVPARDGQEALELYFDSDLRIDVVVTDVEMPRVDGVELVRRLREADGELPVVVITGLRAAGERLTGDLPEGVPVLTKPCRFQELVDELLALRGDPRDPA